MDDHVSRTIEEFADDMLGVDGLVPDGKLTEIAGTIYSDLKAAALLPPTLAAIKRQLNTRDERIYSRIGTCAYGPSDGPERPDPGAHQRDSVAESD